MKNIFIISFLFMNFVSFSQGWYDGCNEGKIVLQQTDTITKIWVEDANWSCYGAYDTTWIQWNLRCHLDDTVYTIETERYDTLYLKLSNKNLTVIGCHVKYRRGNNTTTIIVPTICEYGDNDIYCYEHIIPTITPIVTTPPPPPPPLIPSFEIVNACVSANTIAIVIYWHILTPYISINEIEINAGDEFCIEPNQCFYLFYPITGTSSEQFCF